ncbi:MULTISPECIES: hypothetical protein [Xanthomonas]|uniref:Uncharacterized protein n=2 Tax=Xanthomonas citri TaxID=346 RepID=A0AB33CCT9_XANCI|nr:MULTISPECIES: hypothetical protein [Xanthomonas]MBV6780920.1 hypothetical protein [Xanthomonas campestris pv. trichodesmae]ASK91840.1 hypothetical protein XcvCFBP7111P_10275 [Xanthomonas citri pv. vignicola]MBV6788444.1 hypothetical protein [Xanthomonas campestris pv. clerodendri]MBZ3919239.1 hypothetical protein [Xanthomonas campestris pv. trichodesmae]MBZ3922880.1 hypothetical protein [Xanthomonas citri pv. sesbaniae]
MDADVPLASRISTAFAARRHAYTHAAQARLRGEAQLASFWSVIAHACNAEADECISALHAGVEDTPRPIPGLLTGNADLHLQEA